MTAGTEFTPTRLGRSETELMLPRLWASGPTTKHHLTSLCATAPMNDHVTHSAIGVGWDVPGLVEHLQSADPIDGQRVAGALTADAWTLCLHFGDESTSDKPLGCVSFTPVVLVDLDRVAGLQLDLHAAWVDPEHREHGYSGHLVASLARYLDRHGPWGPPTRGIARPTTVVTITVPRPEKQMMVWAGHLKRYFASGKRTRWNARSVTLRAM
ncbi:MAG: hypothetical protein HY854_12885 [Burkholderiales bacterium]|nr:hypothetical protein [Burkholderiales bacterium]